jgi:hypothetical protein
MKPRFLLISLVLLTVVALSATVVFGTDIFSGTWKQNIAKSTYNSSLAPTIPIVAKVTALANGQKVVVDSVSATGQQVHEEYAVTFDGQGYPDYVTVKPHTGSTDPIFVVSAKKIDNYTYEITYKQGDWVGQVQKHVFSKDGKTQTVTVTGTYAGQPFIDTIVFEKQ